MQPNSPYFIMLCSDLLMRRHLQLRRFIIFLTNALQREKKMINKPQARHCTSIVLNRSIPFQRQSGNVFLHLLFFHFFLLKLYEYKKGETIEKRSPYWYKFETIVPINIGRIKKPTLITVCRCCYHNNCE